jgi:hypothetical protein
MVFAEWASFRGNDAQISLSDLRDMYPSFGDEPVFRRGHIVTTDEEVNDALKEMFCKPLAERFAVSAETMKIRLEDLELLVNEKSRMLF